MKNKVIRQLVLKQVLPVFYLLFLVSPASAAENFASQLLRAFEDKKAIPHYSLSGEQVSEVSAYKIQFDYVKARQTIDPIVGYKAGLTSTAGQNKFKVSNALSGVLFSSGHLTDLKQVKLSSAGKLMLETELGFVLAKPITQPIDNIATLKQQIESVAAVIELPDVGFVHPKKISGTDLIAANVSAHQFIIGQQLDVQNIDNINQLTTQLRHNDKLIYQGKATDALGDQWQALLWLVNQLVSQGHQLTAGEILITGALGKMVPAQEGKYQADFAQLGQVEFTVVK